MREEIPYGELTIHHLNGEINIDKFISTSDELNDFFQNDALIDQTNLISKTHVCVYKNHVVGFITLLADTIQVKSIDEIDCVENYGYKKYPAIKLARLAVDSKFERRGIGRFLLLASIGKAISICDSIGCRYITVDSKKEAIGFYEKYGFTMLKGDVHNSTFLSMYYNIQKVKRVEHVDSLDRWMP